MPPLFLVAFDSKFEQVSEFLERNFAIHVYVYHLCIESPMLCKLRVLFSLMGIQRTKSVIDVLFTVFKRNFHFSHENFKFWTVQTSAAVCIGALSHFKNSAAKKSPCIRSPTLKASISSARTSSPVWSASDPRLFVSVGCELIKRANCGAGILMWKSGDDTLQFLKFYLSNTSEKLNRGSVGWLNHPSHATAWCQLESIPTEWSADTCLCAAAEEGALHLKLCILFAGATSEITKDIPPVWPWRSRERQKLWYASAATRRFNNLYGTVAMVPSGPRPLMRPDIISSHER